MWVLHTLIFAAAVLNASSQNSSEVSGVGVAPSQRPSGDPVGSMRLPMEGGGAVASVAEQRAARPSLTEGGGAVELSTPASGEAANSSAAPETAHSLDAVKQLDVEQLLAAEGEASARNRTSSVVGRKGAPADVPLDTPSVTEAGESAEVQSLFTDEPRSSVTPNIACPNSTLSGNTSAGGNCSQNQHAEVSFPEAPGVKSSEASTVMPTVSKPVVSEHSTPETQVGTFTNNTTAQNTSRNDHPKKKTKPLKPAMTSDENETKEQLEATDTPASKGDYIVPIIGIVLAVPMVVILFMFFYKRSAEFWERRHYKRMDFLIDGMYD
ncbi:uncharacterized protein LOC134532091 [Bacillus rossius redtenbacheri]|uniref:uncharacterized protein LOC134532091 n=1 Tax=Bacillus rossius redtenbacheri TaxID=93214 RepID=UPI002FDD0DA8